jgi:VWFA-related protein
MMPSAIRRFAALALFLALAFATPTFMAAQAQNPPQNTTESPDAQQKEDQAPLTTFKKNVNVVSIFFNVKDKHGLLIPDLKKEDFQIFEDGKPQTIKYFSSESNQPLTLGLLIDTSGSQTRVLPIEKEVGGDFLKDVLREKDLAFLISFDVNVDLLEDFTNSARDLRAGMEKTRINTGGGGGGGIPGIGQGPIPISDPRGTLLYDAIFLAADEKLKSEVGRKAMIIFTDGEDQGSRETINSAIEAAQKSDSMVYVLLIADRAMYPSGDSEMKKIAEQTGGRVIEVGNKPEKLRAAFQQISNELRSQYSIGYTPTNTKADGTFRKIEIKTKEGLKIQARKGYFSSKKEQQ